MADFRKAIKKILKHEGGYVDNPNDPGGETNFGITKRSYPHVDIKNLTKEEAKTIYYKDFWMPMSGDFIDSQEIAEQIFDMSVNAGIKQATKLIQRFFDNTGLKVDGNLGRMTAKAINASDQEKTLMRYKLVRIEYYTKIVRSKKSLREFLYFWCHRTLL